MNRSLTIARGTRRRGNPRETFCVTDANFLWRLSAAVQRLQALTEVAARGARTSQAVHDLTVLEYRIEKMLTEAQISAIEQAIRPREERTACDG